MKVSFMDVRLQERALCVDQNMALAAADLLAAVITARPTHLGGLGRLAVNDRRTRLARAADALTMALAQGRVDALPSAVASPPRIVVEDGLRWRILVREEAPLHSGTQEVEDRIDDPAQAICLLAPSRVGAGEERLEQLPFRVRQITGIGVLSHGQSSP